MTRAPMSETERKLRNALRHAKAGLHAVKRDLAEMPEPFPDWITEWLDAKVQQIAALAAETRELLDLDPEPPGSGEHL